MEIAVRGGTIGAAEAAIKFVGVGEKVEAATVLIAWFADSGCETS